MPNVIQVISASIKDGRGQEARTRALRLKQLFLDNGAESVRYVSTVAGPSSGPTTAFVIEARSLAQLEELAGKVGQDAWFQENYPGNSDPPNVITTTEIFQEIE